MIPGLNKMAGRLGSLYEGYRLINDSTRENPDIQARKRIAVFTRPAEVV